MTDDLEERLGDALRREASRLDLRQGVASRLAGARPWWRRPGTAAVAVAAAAAITVAVVASAGAAHGRRVSVTGTGMGPSPGSGASDAKAAAPVTTVRLPACQLTLARCPVVLPSSVASTAAPIVPSPTPTTTGKRLFPEAPGGPFTGPTAGPATCEPSQLALALGAPVSEESGQHTLDLTLTNASPRACTLDGYPAVTLLDADGPVPFAYHDGGDQEITDAAPAPVVVAAGAAGYARIDKDRCAVGDQRAPTSLHLVTPGATSALTVSVTGATDLSYCGAGDPGSTIHVSPIEATVPATGP